MCKIFLNNNNNLDIWGARLISWAGLVPLFTTREDILGISFISNWSSQTWITSIIQINNKNHPIGLICQPTTRKITHFVNNHPTWRHARQIVRVTRQKFSFCSIGNARIFFWLVCTWSVRALCKDDNYNDVVSAVGYDSDGLNVIITMMPT